MSDERDPRHCRNCEQRGKVYDSKDYPTRRFKCPRCGCRRTTEARFGHVIRAGDTRLEVRRAMTEQGAAAMEELDKILKEVTNE